jgi:hypothetical protein
MFAQQQKYVEKSLIDETQKFQLLVHCEEQTHSDLDFIPIYVFLFSQNSMGIKLFSTAAIRNKSTKSATKVNTKSFVTVLFEISIFNDHAWGI